MKKLFWVSKKIKELFEIYYPFSALLFLATIVAASLWQIARLYFWTDDWDMFLKITHPELGLWGMAPGWFGSGPYRYLHTPFMPLYPIFGLNPTPYFIISIVIYFTAAVCVYLLFLELTKKRYWALASAGIYASLGYIGSYTIFHLSNSYQNLGAVILTTLTLWILAKYFHTNKLRYYVLSIGLFYASLEIENLRSHGLLFLVLGLTFLYTPWKKKISTIFLTIAKLIPFVLIYRQLYSATLGSGNTTTVGAFFFTMSRDKAYAYFTYPFASFSNVIVPDTITKFIYNLVILSPLKIFPELIWLVFFAIVVYLIIKNRKEKKNLFIVAVALSIIEISYFFFNNWAFAQPIVASFGLVGRFTSLLGITLLLLCLYLSVALWKKQSATSRLILFGIVLIFGHYIGYFIGITSYSYLETTDRYLTPSTVGTALILGTIFSLLKYKKIVLTPFLAAAYSIYLIILMNITIQTVVTDVSNPTKNLYETIQKITPSIPSNASLLLDIENNPNVRYRVNSSFPQTAFALFYKAGNRIPYLRSFEEYLYLVKNHKMNIEDVISYYISQWDVVDTTKTVHKLLTYPTVPTTIPVENWHVTTPSTKNKTTLSTETFTVSREKDTLGVNPQFEGEINYVSIVPTMLSITLSIQPLNLENLRFPFSDITYLFHDSIKKEDIMDIDLSGYSSNLPCDKRMFLLALDKERKDFLKNAKVTTGSDTQYSEREFLTDGLFNTNWSARHLTWAENKKEEIIIDLSQMQTVSRLIWINYLKRGTPTQYTLLASDDGISWHVIKEVTNGPSHLDGEIVVDAFPQEKSRFIKMVITNTFSNADPAISEIWVSALSAEDNLRDYSQVLIDKPFSCPAFNSVDARNIQEILGGKMTAKVWWLTDSREDYANISSTQFTVIADGQSHTYNIYIPAQGTSLEKILINSFQIPLQVTLENVSIHSLTFKEIDDAGYIRQPTGGSN